MSAFGSYNTLSDNRMAASRRRSGLGTAALLRKPVSVILEEATEDKLKRHLTLFDLVIIGIAGTIGAGFFCLVGLIASSYAGPSGVVSWVLAGASCVFSGFSYAELSSKIPSEGGAYAYAYVALGELPAMVTGWCLTLEFGIAGSAVARSWADKLSAMVDSGVLGGGAGVEAELGQWHYLLDPVPGLGLSPLAAVLQGLCVLVILRGISVGKKVTTVLTALKMALCVFVVVVGLALFRWENFKPCTPYGAVGILRGTSSAYFGFVGYDEVCALAGECVHPRRDLPRSIALVLAVVSMTYVLGALAISGMLPYSSIDPDAGFVLGFAERGLQWASQVAAVGELVTLPVVVLVCFMAQPRVLFALASDGLMPKSLSRMDRSGNLRNGIVVSGVVCTAVALVAPFAGLDDVISAGVLLIFCVTNSAVIVVRRSKLEPVSQGPCRPLVLVFNALCLVGGFLLRVISDLVSQREGGQEIGWLGMSEVTALGLMAGLAFFVAGAVMVAVAGLPEQPAELYGEGAFHAPLSPWAPALGIVTAWLLMAQLSWEGLLASAWALLAVVVWYTLYGVRHSIGQVLWASSGALSSEQRSLPVNSVKDWHQSRPAENFPHYQSLTLFPGQYSVGGY